MNIEGEEDGCRGDRGRDRDDYNGYRGGYRGRGRGYRGGQVVIEVEEVLEVVVDMIEELLIVIDQGQYTLNVIVLVVILLK